MVVCTNEVIYVKMLYEILRWFWEHLKSRLPRTVRRRSDQWKPASNYLRFALSTKCRILCIFFTIILPKLIQIYNELTNNHFWVKKYVFFYFIDRKPKFVKSKASVEISIKLFKRSSCHRGKIWPSRHTKIYTLR